MQRKTEFLNYIIPKQLGTALKIIKLVHIPITDLCHNLTPNSTIIKCFHNYKKNSNRKIHVIMKLYEIKWWQRQFLGEYAEFIIHPLVEWAVGCWPTLYAHSEAELVSSYWLSHLPQHSEASFWMAQSNNTYKLWSNR